MTVWKEEKIFLRPYQTLRSIVLYKVTEIQCNQENLQGDQSLLHVPFEECLFWLG
jgi:hypothetical protein